MCLRRWVSVIAVLGVLLHAAAVVRHHGLMLAASPVLASLEADLLVLCHGGAQQTPDVPDGLPPGPGPKPSDAKTACPICAWHVPAFALAPVERPDIPATTVAEIAWPHSRPTAMARRHPVCPPARGPPAFA